MAKRRYAGGENVKPELDYGNTNVVREAEERKRGGKCAKIGGKATPPRLDKRRRTGGRTGSESAPLSSAHKPSSDKAP